MKPFSRKTEKIRSAESLVQLSNMVPLALIIGVVSILIQIVWDKVLAKKHKIFSVIPAPLIVVLAGIGINEYFRTSNPSFSLDSKLAR